MTYQDYLQYKKYKSLYKLEKNLLGGTNNDQYCRKASYLRKYGDHKKGDLKLKNGEWYCESTDTKKENDHKHCKYNDKVTRGSKCQRINTSTEKAKPSAKPASKPVAKAAAKPAAKPVAKPAAKQAAKQAAKPVENTTSSEDMVNLLKLQVKKADDHLQYTKTQLQLGNQEAVNKKFGIPKIVSDNIIDIYSDFDGYVEDIYVKPINKNSWNWLVFEQDNRGNTSWILGTMSMSKKDYSIDRTVTSLHQLRKLINENGKITESRDLFSLDLFNDGDNIVKKAGFINVIRNGEPTVKSKDKKYLVEVEKARANLKHLDVELSKAKDGLKRE